MVCGQLAVLVHLWDGPGLAADVQVGPVSPHGGRRERRASASVWPLGSSSTQEREGGRDDTAGVVVRAVLEGLLVTSQSQLWLRVMQAQVLHVRVY